MAQTTIDIDCKVVKTNSYYLLKLASFIKLEKAIKWLDNKVMMKIYINGKQEMLIYLKDGKLLKS